MEKGKPHHKLHTIKGLVSSGRVRATATAFEGALELGIQDLAGMCSVVLSLESIHFYKSMTTHADHRIWQDVYRIKIRDGAQIYLKLTVVNDVLIVSFKER